MRRLSAAWITALIAVANAPVTKASERLDDPAAVVAAVDPDEMLLVAVELDQLTLSESLAVYGEPDDPFVPLGEIARLLDLDVSVSPGAERVTGRLGETGRALSLDVGTGRGRLGGRDLQLPLDDFRLDVGDVYVRASSLDALLPLKVAADAEALSLKLTATETLPVQARRARMERLNGLGSDEEASGPTLRVAAPYRLASAPAFDVSLDLAGDTGDGPVQRRYDLRAAGDLLGAGFQGYVGSDDRGEPTDLRVLFERRDPAGRLLGPIRATAAGAGDVFTPGLALGAHSQGGRGFAFSTGKLEQTSVFDRVDLRGELPVGSDVELYVNDVLRSGQRTPVQGRYEFLNVPLVRGPNVIRIVTYGPRGDRFEETRVVNVGGGQLRPKQSVLEFGLVQQDRTVFSFNDSGFHQTPEIRHEPGGTRMVTSLSYGVSSGLTLTGGGALYAAGRADQRGLLTLGARTSLAGLAVQADGAYDDGGGAGFNLGLAGQPWGVAAVARHSEFRDGFVDEVLAVGDPLRALRRHTELTADSSLISLRGRLIPTTFRAQHQAFADGITNSIASVRASGTVADVVVSTGLDHQIDRGPTYTNRRTTGVVAASYFAAERWLLRGSLDYQVGGDTGVRAAAFTLDREVSQALALRFGLGHGFGHGSETALQAGAVLRTRLGDLAFNADYGAAQNALRMGVRLAFGLAQGLRGRYGITRPGPATSGSAVFDAFVDTNGNGRRDPSEAPIQNAVLEGGERRVVTGADGRVFVTGLSGGGAARLQVGLEELEDPFLLAPPQSIEIAARPGLVARIPYPLAPTSEVFARVMIRRGDKLIGLSSVRVAAVTKGKTAREAVTEFDGTIVFEHLRAGPYELELDPEQAARLGMRLKRPVAFTVDPAGGAIPDVVVEVTFGKPAPTAIIADARDWHRP